MTQTESALLLAELCTMQTWPSRPTKRDTDLTLAPRRTGRRPRPTITEWDDPTVARALCTRPQIRHNV